MKKYELLQINLAKNIVLPKMGEYFNRKLYVEYGDDNLYPNYLINQYNNCSIHKSIVNSKRELVCGDGMICLNEPMAIINMVNSNGETVEDVYRKCALDYILFGGFALNIIWSRDRKSIAEFYHLDFSRIRSGKINAETGMVEEYYFCSDWTNTRKYVPKKYPRMNQGTSEPSQILYHFEYSPDQSYYPIPDYSGGLAAINIEINIKNFHNNNLKNGFTPSLFINLNNGMPSEDEKDQITNELIRQYSSPENAGRPVISFNESKELSPEIVQIGTNASDNYYTALYDDINRSILSSHRVSSGELFGISTAGKLGTSNEIIEHSTFFNNTVIKPYIQEILPVFNKIMSLKFEKPIKIEVKPLTVLEIINKQSENVE